METWDCIVAGGGAAGLSAALALGRARRTALVIDAGGQSNRAAHAMHNLIGNDGRAPGDFYAAVAEELTTYDSVELRAGEIAAARVTDDGFAVELGGGETLAARRLVLATGMEYRPPALPGVAARWGGSVFHCPFCHGWEVRGRALGVLNDGAHGVHGATLLTAWSDDVTLYTNGPAALDAEQRAGLERAGVTVDERPVAGLRGDELDAVVFADGDERACEGLMVPFTLHQRSGLAASLGAAFRSQPPMSEELLEVDMRGRTSVPGLHAAGDAALQGGPSVPAAIATGTMAGASVVNELTGAA